MFSAASISFLPSSDISSPTFLSSCVRNLIVPSLNSRDSRDGVILTLPIGTEITTPELIMPYDLSP